MPLKDDLLMRTLDELTQTVTAALGGSGDRAGAEALIARGYREHVGIDGAFLRRLPSSELLAVLSTAGALDRERAHLLAALMQAEGALLPEDEAIPLQRRALDLLLEAALAGLDLEGTEGRVDALLQALAAEDLPDVTERRLFDYYRQHDRWLDAEDSLLVLLERSGPERELVTRGEALYDAMRRADDATLASQGLDRSELEGRYREFRAQLTA